MLGCQKDIKNYGYNFSYISPEGKLSNLENASEVRTNWVPSQCDKTEGFRLLSKRNGKMPRLCWKLWSQFPLDLLEMNSSWQYKELS